MAMDKGTYVLILEILKPVDVKVGALGVIFFKSGTYAYIGSAMNSLSKRLERHMKKKKKLHWHLDYLTSLSNVQVKKIFVFRGKRMEEELSTRFSKKYKGIEKFGASDMKRVNSNLYVVDDKVEEFVISLGGVKIEKNFSSHS
jgi:Uri superfamily endonuclease